MIEESQNGAGPDQPAETPGGIESLMSEWARPTGGDVAWDASAVHKAVEEVDVDALAGLMEPTPDVFAPEPPPEFVGAASHKLRAGARVTAPRDDAMGPWRQSSFPAASLVPTILVVAGLSLSAYFALFVESAPVAVLAGLLGLVGGLFCRVLLKE